MILGDHPCTSYGPPVSLGWHYLEYDPLYVNEYEYHHSRRRPLRFLCLNYYRRKDILAANGHTVEEINKSMKEISRIKMNRSITRATLPYQKIEEALASACRKAKKKLMGKDKSKKRTWREEDELDYSRSLHTRTSSILRDSNNKQQIGVDDQ